MALTPAQTAAYKAEAAKLRGILSRGARSVTTDGVSVTYDLEACRQRLGEINRILNPNLRRRLTGIYLGRP